jgi:hypothetical protein
LQSFERSGHARLVHKKGNREKGNQQSTNPDGIRIDEKQRYWEDY